MPRKEYPEGTRAPNGEGSVYLGSDGYWHGRVTVGTKDDGSPDRRHIKRKATNPKAEDEVIKAVNKLIAARDDGAITKAGPVWTMEKWLTHWVEDIAAPTVRDSTADAYRNAVYKHLIPGLGAHRLTGPRPIQPEHFEKLYRKMIAAGHKPANAHQVHRTARTALYEAVRRGHMIRNPAALAKPPRVEQEEIQPYEVEEVQKILAAAAHRRNSARWAIALVLGLRQGEVLGLRWADIDLDAGTLRVRESRLRPKYRHGCPNSDPCGRKAGYCPQKINTRKPTGPVKSFAGKRPMGVPGPITTLLREQLAAQDKERTAAGNLWQEGGWVFTTPTGQPLHPNTDYREWKDLLCEAGVRDARLHDARHTAATLLLILEVTNRTTQGLMGWTDASMPARYQHLVKRVRDGVAKRQEGLLWDAPQAPAATARQRRKKRQTRQVKRTY
jgi:integrase